MQWGRRRARDCHEIIARFAVLSALRKTQICIILRFAIEFHVNETQNQAVLRFIVLHFGIMHKSITDLQVTAGRKQKKANHRGKGILSQTAYSHSGTQPDPSRLTFYLILTRIQAFVNNKCTKINRLIEMVNLRFMLRLVS